MVVIKSNSSALKFVLLKSLRGLDFLGSLRHPLLYGDYTTKTRAFGGFWGLTDEVLSIRKEIKRTGRAPGTVY